MQAGPSNAFRNDGLSTIQPDLDNVRGWIVSCIPVSLEVRRMRASGHLSLIEESKVSRSFGELGGVIA